MATISISDPHFFQALRACVQTLRRLADYQLEQSLDQRMQDLGERKEFLNQEEHEELLALVAFSQQRTLDKLEAKVALQRLQEFVPELVDAA